MASLKGTVDSTVWKVVVACVVPLIGLWITGAIGGAETAVLPLGALGLISWFIGVRWYGVAGMGLRGHRPLYASIGFAVLGWVAFLVLRLATVRFFGVGSSAVAFFTTLLFEALAVQLWAFGLVFRAVADWRGPLTAAIASGILFGMVGITFFQESFISSTNALLYFSIWGILYGVIRLRTGGIGGMVIVQGLQSFTAWTVLVADSPPAASQLNSLYLLAGIAYALIIWRLWPKTEEDYRV